MCKGKQELELLGKHEQGCLHGSHLIPATAAPQHRFPFIQVSYSSAEAQGEAVDSKEMRDMQSAPGCSEDELPISINARLQGLCWE